MPAVNNNNNNNIIIIIDLQQNVSLRNRNKIHLKYIIVYHTKLR